MKKINPQISQKFLDEIKNQDSKIIGLGNIKIRTCKNVFPPKSAFSHTSEYLHEIFGDLEGKNVVDVGTGTGIQAIWAAKKGAGNVVALDINPQAVVCARKNIKLNKVGGRVVAIESDLFKAIKKEKIFDVVIANLPISDFPIYGVVESSLYDPHYRTHKKFFKEVGNYLKPDGIIVMSHIDFKGNGDFADFEIMMGRYGYSPKKFSEIEDLGYRWRMYKIKRK